MLDISAKQARLTEVEHDLNSPDVWSAPERAGKLAREQKALSDVIKAVEGAEGLLGAAADDELDQVEAEIVKLEDTALLSGPHDHSSAILSIHAGTGGVDAMDWAEMLLRMYLRLAEKRGWLATLAEEQRGEEAGIKRATVLVDGVDVYGWLKGEAGVHRLVRLSPFNAKNLRQTSFALVDVIPEVEDTAAAVINPDDIRVDVYRASGHGGQGVNTTDSAVRITHLPTNIVVTCQNERSQTQNKQTAMKVLESKLARLREVERDEERAAIRGEIPQAAWGNQIRNYVLQPYQLVKDTRTGIETSDVQAVLNGELNAFLDAELRFVK